MSYRYQTINNFGQRPSGPQMTLPVRVGSVQGQPSYRLQTDDPLSYCLQDNIDNRFDHASSIRYGPGSRSCQKYMSDRCALEWDGFCEIAYNNKDVSYPNQGYLADKPTNVPKGVGNPVSGATSLGNILLHNTMQKRFCKVSGAIATTEPFDPLVANSPSLVTYIPENPYNNSYNLVCSVDQSMIDDGSIDNDPVMNKGLSNPPACYDTLFNICENAKAKGQNLGDTKIGKFCRLYYNS